jgi:hypothetical protein
MALPTYVATGTFDLTQGDATPGLPAGWQEGDIFIMIVEGGRVYPPDGWYELPVSPKSASSSTSGFWRRATASETAPTLKDTGDHTFPAIMAFRGCARWGNPWNKIAGGTDTVSNTTRTANGLTTTVNDCLVVVVQGDGLDNVTGQRLSAWTNADLANVTERVDQWSSLGGGGGWGAATGEKATAGSVGDTTATSSGSAQSQWFAIALKPSGTEDARIYEGPYFVGRGATASGISGTISPAIPSAAQEHDVLLLVCEGQGTISPPSGWAEVPGSPQIQSSHKLSVFWKRASASESAPSVSVGTDHLMGAIAAFRGCHPEGDPWDDTDAGVDNVSDGNRNVGAATTTVDDVLVLTIVGDGADIAGRQLTTWTPHDEATDAINYVYCLDDWVTTGGGGGMGMAAWEMIHAGSFAARSVTQEGSGNVSTWILLSLKAGPGALSGFPAPVQVIWS